MKFRVTFKTPDAVSEALDSEEFDGESEELKQAMENFTLQWIEFGEYLTVEFDTARQTCKVVKVGQ